MSAPFSPPAASKFADLADHHPLPALAGQLAAMWDRGWQPLDLARVFGKELGLTLAILADCLSLDRAGWHAGAAPLWTHQADELGAHAPWWQHNQPYWPQFAERHGASDRAVHAAATSFGLVVADPPAQPLLEAPPTQIAWSKGASGDDGVLAKVRALLAKAESTEFDHEAEALSAKAQELIARHSIDVALLADEIDIPGGKRLYVGPPYAKAKFLLLANIAQANGCRSVWNDQRKTATIVGHQNDLLLAEVLFTSLLLQGTGAVLAAGAQSDGWGGSNTKSWRNAFWQGYAHRIGQRLTEATTSTQARHEAETGHNLLPVLAKRSDAVDKALDDAFPQLGSLRTSVSNGEGLNAGRRFADSAELDANHSVPRSSPRELSR